MVAFFHSTVLPSDVSRRARGTRSWPEGSHQLALAMAVPVASPHKRPAAYAGFGKPRPFIPVPPKRSVEFRFQEFLDEAANAGPHPGFQGIEPIVPKKKRSFSRFRRSFYGIRFHGVISIGAPTPIRFEQTNWRLRHLQIPTTPATAPGHRASNTVRWSLRHD